MFNNNQPPTNKSVWMMLLVTLALLMSGCANAAPATATVPAPAPVQVTEPPIAEPLTAEDKAGLVAALQAVGATVESGETVSQPFFTPAGNIIKVNGSDVQVFEYESAEAMAGEASQVAPDGSSIGSSMVDWMDIPHFYKAGRIIVLYVGSDEKVLAWLENALGPQFAGG
jgi:hypothetical protein